MVPGGDHQRITVVKGIDLAHKVRRLIGSATVDGDCGGEGGASTAECEGQARQSQEFGHNFHGLLSFAMHVLDLFFDLRIRSDVTVWQ